MSTWDPKTIASKIDHTLLKAEATPAQIEALCLEAKTYGFASVCVNPLYVPLCAKLLKNSGVKVCTVAGFPLGASAPEVKAFETALAVRDGADEVDMVLSVGLVKAGEWDLVRRDIAAVVKAAGQACVKVILETCLLTDAEKQKACELCAEAGAAFVKTSTGMNLAGATKEDVALMKESARGLLVKAAGGIRTYEDALVFLEAGADRIGASASIAITEAAKC